MCKNPCWRNGKDCPDRKLGCRSGCRDWQDYEAAKAEQYDARKLQCQGAKNFQDYARLKRRAQWQRYNRKKKLMG